MSRCRGRERQGFEPGNELLDHPKVFNAARRFLDPVIQLGEGDRRYADLFGQPIELLAQPDRTVFDQLDANVGVEHVLQHQSGSRCSMSSCRKP